ncbi:dienelactone hydrolase family protein [Frankia sp. R82]|uniref:dienelactone hydrolase family protein n=1 Tax=Frankia sp. R82 TaxID=2950553 RepID=UPI002043EBA5|nr:dienelactone hydrolase family protein [Frankia sp. R82]MCM3885500.1 dienelactone hydrolase family protein [Frankia sp. R82]
MCHAVDSRPPAPPYVIPTEDHGPLTLTTTDGVRFPAYLAHPAHPNGQAVVILPDVRGAHAYYRDLAVRFAEAGLHAAVIDYYGHLTDDPRRGDDFDWQAKLPDVDSDTVRAAASAALDQLRRDGAHDLFTVGFCFGGSQSWLLSATDLPVNGVVGFYGDPDLVEPRIAELHKPMLLLVAGADVATSRERSEQFAHDLAQRGVPHQQTIYDGAPHSFFDRSSHEWGSACTDAWRRILAFVAAHSTSQAARQPARYSTSDEHRMATYRRLAEFLPALPELAQSFAHRTIAKRPGLTPDQRELVILGALIALGDTGLQLTAHAQAAAGLGITGDQLGEIILQTVPYAGFPRAINAALALADHITTAAPPEDSRGRPGDPGVGWSS